MQPLTNPTLCVAFAVACVESPFVIYERLNIGSDHALLHR
jgi:hypothetical protein